VVVAYCPVQKGFTLIELLLYIAIGTLILIATSALLMVLIESREKDQIAGEVEGQGLQAMQLITQNVRNAASINSPATSTSAASLSLTMPGGTSPTVFDLNNGALRIAQGGAEPAAITDSQEKVLVTNLTFSNLSINGTPGVVRISITLTGSSVSSWYEYSYSRTFTGSAALRP
jgi:Tfp pilus assembly protein PilW